MNSRSSRRGRWRKRITTRRRMSGWETESLREGRVDIYRPPPPPTLSPSGPRSHSPVPSRPHRATTYHPRLVRPLRIVRLPRHPCSRALPYALRRVLTLEQTLPQPSPTDIPNRLIERHRGHERSCNVSPSNPFPERYPHDRAYLRDVFSPFRQDVSFR